MAKKNQKKQTPKSTNTSNTNTNLTPKGMVKDTDASYLGDKNWSHAINAINNSVDGDTGVIGNEPANLSCAETPYPVIGVVHLHGDKWVLFLTNDIESEIGVFDDSKCEYQRLINDRCLDFKRDNLIVGASKENFDCTWQVYWDDRRNPSRSLNIDDIPWLNHEDSIPGAPCVTYEDDNPLRLDCEKIRLAPLMDIPCITLSKAPEGGSLRNGSYQVYFAYAVNDQVIGDYVGISNIQPIWSHEDTSGSMDIKITNIDKDFEQYVIVMIMKHQGGQIAKRLGVYSTEQSDINIDFINPSLADVNIEDLPRRRESYEKSHGMYVVNDYLIRTNPVEQFDFNYQPLANNITTEWVSAQYPAEYYKNGGNKPTFVRDEQYAFFIRFIYNTGERSSSYHIPGRAPQMIGAGGHPASGNMEDSVWGSNINSIDVTDKVFEVYNTASTTATGLSEATDDGGVIKATGLMGYWESTERYPATDPTRWAGLCGLPIRHHKMPDETLVSPGNPTHLSTPDGQNINILGVQFSNIAPPLDNNGNVIANIQGYEVLVGGREGNKTIIAKGIIRNMMEYESLDGDGNEGSGSVTHLMPNYPYNDLGTDPFLMPPGNGNSAPSWYSTPDHWLSGNESTRVGQGTPPSPGLNTVTSNAFTFHSPETQFEKIYLNPYEIKTYGTLNGLSSGHFKPSEEHPKQKLLQNTAAVIGAVVGIGYAMSEMRGKRNVKRTGGKSLSIGQDGVGHARSGGSALNTVGTTWAMTVGSGASIVPGTSNTSQGGGDWTMSAPNASNTYSATNVGNSPAALGSQGNTATQNTIVDTLSPFGGGRFAEGSTVSTWGAAEAALTATMPGHVGPGVEYEYEGSRYKSVPTPLAVLTGTMSFLNFVSTGGQEIVDLIYNLMSYHNYAYKYNSHGFYGTMDPFSVSTQFRTNVEKGMYVGGNLQNFTGNIKINNLHRPNTVVLQTGGNNLPTPQGSDNSKFIIGDTIGDCDWYEPSTEVTRSISANYVSLKVENDNQYGQLQNIKQFPVRGCTYNFIDQQKEDSDGNLIPITPVDRFTTSALFGGDNYINRYTEKVIMPFWWNFMKDEPDGTPFDYRLYTNIPVPRFWMNTEKYRLDELTKPLSTLSFNFNDALPSSLFHLDRDPNSIYSSLFGGVISATASAVGNLFTTGSMNQTPGGLFTIQNGYMYTHNSGIQDFFVESEMNLALRDYGDDSEKRHYDKYEFTDVNELFHADHIKKGNYYKYDKGLSKKYFQLGISGSFGELQPSWYDPIIAETCWTEYPKRLIYSLQATKEAKKDFWRVFLPENYKDFKDRVTTIKGISQLGAVMLFPTLSPRLFTGVDTIQTNSTKFTIGDGGLFNKDPQNISNSDISHEYGSCESARSVVNTPAGVFYISQAQGKIFQYGGKGLSPISDQGMKWWFNKYLPSELLAAFPEIEDCPQAVDNPVAGVGCQSIYDPNNDLVYFSKKDYVPLDTMAPCIQYIPCEGFVYNLTLCDGAAQVATCPDGFTYNPTTGMCELTTVEPALPSGGEGGEVDIVIAVDSSNSVNGNNNIANMQNFINDFINGMSAEIATGQVRIGLVHFGSGRDTANPLALGGNPAGADTMFEPGQQVMLTSNTVTLGNWVGNTYDAACTNTDDPAGTSIIGGIWSGLNLLYGTNSRNVPKKLITIIDGPQSTAGGATLPTTLSSPADIYQNMVVSPATPDVAIGINNDKTNNPATTGWVGIPSGIDNWVSTNIINNANYTDIETFAICINPYDLDPNGTTPSAGVTQSWRDYTDSLAHPGNGYYGSFNTAGSTDVIVNGILAAITPPITYSCVDPACVLNGTMCTCEYTTPVIWEDVVMPIDITDETYFKEISWTTSYDPKSQAWISFHDWHPELSMNSINHFMTTKTTTTDVPQCPPGYTFDSVTGECCVHVEETNTAHLNISEILAQVESQDATVTAFGQDLDIAIVMDTSGSTGGPPNSLCSIFNAQVNFVDAFVTAMIPGMSTGTNTVRIGLGIWNGDNSNCSNLSNYTVLDSLTNLSTDLDNTVGSLSLLGCGGVVDTPGGGTSYETAVQEAAEIFTNGGTPSSATKKIAIIITDTVANVCANNGGCTTSSIATTLWNNNFGGGGDVETIAVYASANAPTTTNWWNNLSCLVQSTSSLSSIGNDAFAVDSSNYNDVAADVVASITTCECPVDFTEDVPTNPCSPDPADPPPNCVNCSCPPGYTLIPGQTCSSVDVPICKKVSCDCFDPPNPQATFTVTGTCPTPTTPDWIAAGNPGWADPDPVLCHWVYDDCVPANYTVGGIWKHNVRTDKFANFYGEDFPWEVDLLQASGQAVNTIRNVEYALESYVYKNDGRDRFHVLDYNFDEAEIYNTEQTSGLLKLNITPKNNAPLITQYPIINVNDIDILYSKEEQKYRFNQFWDVTNDRGEFTGVQEPVYITQLNGYIRDLNMANININKPAFERKKFRHYYNHVILRRSVSNDHKMLLRLMNTKINLSQR